MVWPCVVALASGACSATSDGGAVLFDRDYALETFATTADGLGAPDGLAWHGDALIIADEGSSAIRRLERTGWKTLADKGAGIVSPEDLAIAPDGTIYFTDDSAGGVWIAKEGTVRRLPGTEGWDPPTEGIALAPDGRLLIGETRNGQVVVFNPGARIALAALPYGKITKPESMAFDANGNLYVADNEENLIHRFDAATGRRDTFSWPEVSPESITVVRDALWLTDSDNGKVYQLDGDGKLETVAVFSHALQNVSGISGDRQGNVYISIQTDLDDGEGLIVVLRRRR